MSGKRGFLAVFKRECKRIVSRPLYLVTTLILPVFCYVYFVSMMQEGLPLQLPIAVVDHDDSALSRKIIRNMDATQTSHIIMRLNSEYEARKQMQQGNIYAYVVVPNNLQADVLSNRQPEIVFYTNNSYLIAGSLLMRDLTQITALSSGSANLTVRAAKGQSAEEIKGNVQPIVIDSHAPGNPWTNYSMYLSTILSHGLLQILILTMTVYVVGIELKQKTSRKWLILGDKSLFKSIVGKLLPYTIIFSLIACTGNMLFYGYMQFTLNGSILAMMLAAILMVIAYQAIGLMIIGMLIELKLSLTIAAVFGVLGISLSGLTFPVEIMDSPLQGFSQLFPIRHYFLIYIEQALRGLPISWSLWHYAALLLLCLIPLLCAIRLKKALIYQDIKQD